MNKRNLNIVIKKVLLVLSILLGIQFHGESQNGRPGIRYDTGFSSYQKASETEFARFQKDYDSLFIEFLTNTWNDFDLSTGKSNSRSKPRIQPNIDSRKEGINDIRQDTTSPSGDQLEYRLKYDEAPGMKTNYHYYGNNIFEFFGEKTELQPVRAIPPVSPVDNYNIICFYRHFLKDTSLQNTAKKLLCISKNLSVNDYGYFLLLQQASQNLFDEVNKRILFSWTCLLRNGLDVKVGYEGNNIFLLMACDYLIYNKPTISIGEKTYYLFVFPGQEQPSSRLKTYTYKYLGTTMPVSLKLMGSQRFPDHNCIHEYSINKSVVKISTNLFLIEFMNSYPACDLSLYFNTPMSEKTFLSIDAGLRPLLKGKTNVEKVNEILAFIQQSFLYKTDKEQFRQEKYMFSDEAVYYPFTDCEDRSVLFAYLVHRYTGLPVIGLDYPNHVSVGVNFHGQVSGDSVSYKQRSYTICDPTYFGAKAGMTPEIAKKTRPEIIEIAYEN